MRNQSSPVARCVLGGAMCCHQFATECLSSVLTFDEVPPMEYRAIENGYGGLLWTNFFIYNTASSPGFACGVISAPGVAFNGLGNPAFIGGSSPFTLGSAYLTAVHVSGMQIRVQGYLGGNPIHDRTYAVSDAAPTLIHFNYVGVDQVCFTQLSGGIFVMDNLSLAVSDTNTVCTFAILQDNGQHGPGTETGSVSVFAPGGCPWSVLNTNAWITITSPMQNTNDGSVTYTVASNLTGFPRSGCLDIAGRAFAVTQFAFGGTNLAELGRVEVATIGHSFHARGEFEATVADFLIDQNQSPGGGALLPPVSANFDTNNQFRLTVSAPPGFEFQVRPPPGHAVHFGGQLTWQGNSSNGPSRFGTLAVEFDDLAGTAPGFSGSRTVLSDFHGFVGFGDIQSTAFANDLAFASMTLTATVPSLNTGAGLLDYSPHSDSALVLSYTTSAANDPGRFVSIVPTTRPLLSIAVQPNGDITVSFTGTLQSAGDVHGSFADVPGEPKGTYTIPKSGGSAPQYFRARR